MVSTTLLALALAAAGGARAQNMLRFGCSELVAERLDPLVDPGIVPSPHLHQIIGGDSFNVSMPIDQHDLAEQSRCTTCTFAEDFSNYWTAQLFFHHRNGSFHRVRTIGNGGPQGELVHNRGMDIYYIQPFGARAGSLTAFKKGFRMLSGNPKQRNANGMTPGICHRCFPRNQRPFGGAPCTGQDTAAFPKTPCEGGLRATIYFPTCWNGVDLDSPDHKSHMAYPSSQFGGSCPASHPVQVPQLMYELLWDTSEFNDQSMWPENGQPFVYAMGDASGYGQHGDYMFGWEGDSLQRAMDRNCNLDRCNGVLTYQTPAQAEKCGKPQTAVEQVDGWIDSLPGGFVVTYEDGALSPPAAAGGAGAGAGAGGFGGGFNWWGRRSRK